MAVDTCRVRIIETIQLGRRRAHEMLAVNGAKHGRCRAETRSGRCPAHARWAFILGDGRCIEVCRQHANCGERRHVLRVES